MMNLDISVGLLLLVGVTVARLRGHPLIWRMFWLGFALGMVWELGFFLDGPLFTETPSYHMMQAYPVHPWLQPLVHSLWDGGLFLVGAGAVRLLCRAPHFTTFRWQELAVMLVWGNAQELAVELTATQSGMWSFVPKPWNPHLFYFGQGEITLLPQVIWNVAPLLFYLGVLLMQSAPTFQVREQVRG